MEKVEEKLEKSRELLRRKGARSFPGPWRVEPTEGGHFVVKDAGKF
jgi:hypothetical protein